MYVKRLTFAFACLFLTPGCDVDPTAVSTTPTATGASSTPVTAAQAAQAPIISELTSSPDSVGNLILRLKAVDPAGDALSITWKVDQGQLSATTGPTVLWRPPKAAGTFSATAEVVNAKGLKRTASLPFTVTADGEATVATPAVISAPVFVNAASGTPGATGVNGQFQLPVGGSGVFQVPSPVPSGTGGLFVTPNPNAPTPTPAAPASPFTQPVSTPQPGASALASPVPQPLATPTPTPAPASPVVLPTPTARPATPAPGVRTPPDSKWYQVDPNALPANARTENFASLHFIDNGSGAFATGYAVGTSGTVIRTSNSGVTWTNSNSGIPTNFNATRVFFANANFGWVTGNQGKVFRTSDGGANWVDVSPSFQQTNGVEITGLTVMNQAIVILSTADGKIFRTENADAAAAGTVTYSAVTFDTKPAARPNDICGNLLVGDSFATAGDSTTSWHAGSDGIFRADSDGNPNWVRFAVLGGSDGRGCAMTLSNQNNLWVGTDTGTLFRSFNAAGGTPTFDKFIGAAGSTAPFRNREFGNGPAFLRVSGINDVAFVGDNFGWIATNDGHVYDTRNATNTLATDPVTWRDMNVGRVLTDIQIQNRAGVDAGGNATIEFFGWGVGNGGAIFRYLPQ